MQHFISQYVINRCDFLHVALLLQFALLQYLERERIVCTAKCTWKINYKIIPQHCLLKPDKRHGCPRRDFFFQN